MNLILNLVARLSGLSSLLADNLPLLGAVGGILGAASSIALRAAATKDVASLLAALHPTTSEASAVALGVGLIKQHFSHKAVAAQVNAPAQAALPTPPAA